MISFYNESELKQLGFKTVGKNVLISRKASFYGIENMSLGNNVRIDDFCILSGKIILGSYIHISAYTAMYGSYGIELEDYTGLSPRCTVFSATDDFSGGSLIGPMVNEKDINLIGGKVLIKRYSQIGAGSLILPSVHIGEGVAVGAMSMVNKSLDEWGIYAGIPCKRIKERSKELINLL